MDNLLGSRLTMKTKSLGLSVRDFLNWVDWWEKTYPMRAAPSHRLESRIAVQGETGLNFSMLPDHDYLRPAASAFLAAKISLHQGELYPSNLEPKQPFTALLHTAREE